MSRLLSKSGFVESGGILLCSIKTLKVQECDARDSATGAKADEKVFIRLFAWLFKKENENRE